MKELSAVVAQLEKGAAAAESAALREPAARLQKGLALLDELAPRALPAHADVRGHLDALARHARNLADPETVGELAAFDLQQLRAACTRCHLQFRGDNAARGLFPNSGNALFGTVQLLRQDGSASDDRSGVVVFLEGAGLPTAALPRAPRISQRGRQFDPSVLAITPGTTVRFPNDDLVFHNVFSLSRGNAFDLGVYGCGVDQSHTFRNTGLVMVHCNIHPDMAAHVLVLNNRAAATTSAAGFWCIPDLPDGEYTLRSWHPLAEVAERSVRVAGGRAEPCELTVRETKVRVQHSDKNGRPYPRKY
jgi:hypothetical protein